MNIMTTVILIVGLVFIVAGAEVLVREASQLALIVGISPLIIWLTVEAYGTSTPEMVVSLRSSFSNHESISIGNVVGSSSFNILAVLGVAGCLAPNGLDVSDAAIRLIFP